MDVFVAFLIIALLFVARFALPALVMALYSSVLNRLYAHWG